MAAAAAGNGINGINPNPNYRQKGSGAPGSIKSGGSKGSAEERARVPFSDPPKIRLHGNALELVVQPADSGDTEGRGCTREF